MNTRFATPDEVEAAFYHAFEVLDPHLMEQVWDDDPQAVCIHPGGDLLSGKTAILQSWLEIFGAAQPPILVHRTLQQTGDDALVVRLVEELIRPGGSHSPPARVLASNLYRRGHDGWRLFGHHASLPVMGTHPRERAGRLH